MKLSLRVAALSTAGRDGVRHAHRARAHALQVPWRGAVNLLLVLPLTTPEVVLGSSLLSLFLDVNVRTGFSTIVIAHIMFSVSYVALTVRARIRGFDWTLEEAAMDLGRAAVPGLLQGDAADHRPRHRGGRDARVRPLARRFHHHAVQRRQPRHLPAVRVWRAPAAFPPQINVLATSILLVSLLALGATVLWQQRTLRQRGLSVTPLT